MMNGEYIYDIFVTTEANEAHDLLIGMAMLQVDKPIPADLTEREIGQFIGRHYDALVKTYAYHDVERMAEVVKVLEEEDIKKAEEVAKAE